MNPLFLQYLILDHISNCDDGRKYLQDDSFNIVSGKGFLSNIGRENIPIPN